MQAEWPVCQEAHLPKQITLNDVAREAGVSAMTVSRVVNNKGEISANTRNKVQQVINRLGYRPSHIARGLATNRTGTLGLVVPDIANPFFSELARAAENVAYESGFNVFLCNSGEERERELRLLHSLEQKRVDGLLLCSPRLTNVRLKHALKRHAAVVIFNRRLTGAGYGLVLVDDRLGGRMVTEHLFRTGHRDIGYLAGLPTSYSGKQRLAGYRHAFRAQGIPDRPDWVKSCPPTIEGGKKAALDLLKGQPQLTALVCYNDLVAVGALHACAALDRAIPDDLAIVGFDDIPLAALVTPALTTCAVPLHEIGRVSMQILLQIIKGVEPVPDPVIIRPRLTVRSSAPSLSPCAYSKKRAER
jgi:LacI family transcriptional regulator